MGKHIAGGAGFISNFLLWNESGYFDNAAETKPLLHLWSLGIEEQFYIIWPLLLWLAWKQRQNLLNIAIVVGIISFVLNVYEVRNDALAAFYSPQTRFWELMAGSVLAYITRHKQDIFHEFKQWLDTQINQTICAQAPEENGMALRNAQSVFGAVLIAIGILLITKERQFPGWWAVFPTLGALLIISAGTQAWLNRVVLSNRVLVWFGLISYPLYLWHWPLLSFTRIAGGKVPSSETRIGVVLISIALAWLTYKLIEKPIRFGKYGKTKTLALVVLMIVVCLVGYKCFAWNGFESRPINKAAIDLAYDTSKFKYFACPTSFHDSKNLSTEFCSKSSDLPATFAIVGDSFANDKFYGIASLDKDHSWLLAGKVGGCPPIYGIEVKDNCLKHSENDPMDCEQFRN
ncbi:MAG: acyltransferase [Gallionella sp.]|nr:acyltransferase [Gallionella sp.]